MPFLAFSALVAPCEGERRGEVRRVGGLERVGVVHRRTITGGRERIKNITLKNRDSDVSSMTDPA
jgi:hypothetical protein